MATLSDQKEKEETTINENSQFLDNFLKTMKEKEKDCSPGAKIKLAKFKKEWSGFFSDDKADSREDEKKEILNNSGKQMKQERTGARPKTKIIQKNYASFSSSSEVSCANCSTSSEDSEKTSSCNGITPYAFVLNLVRSFIAVSIVSPYVYMCKQGILFRAFHPDHSVIVVIC